MTSKDIKTLVVIMMIGATVFGGLLGWAEHANHSTPETRAVGIGMRNAATLQIGGGN